MTEGEIHHRIMKLQNESGLLQRKTEAETQRLEELEALRRQVVAKVDQQRQLRGNIGGVYACKTEDLRLVKRLRVLEIQRNDHNRKASQMDLSNAKVRAKINADRRKITLLNTVHARLSRELLSQEAQTQQLVQQSDAAYTELEEAKKHTSQMGSLNVQEQQECDRLCAEAAAMVARQNEARSFVQQVTQKRKASGIDGAGGEEEDHDEVPGEAGAGAAPVGVAGEEHILKSRLRDLRRGAAAEEAHIRDVDRQLLNAEQAFKRLRQASGLSSTEEIVRAFVANEDENFSLFNFIQQTNDDISHQQEVLEKIQQEQRRFQAHKEQKSEHTYAVINSLKSKRQQAADKSRELKGQIAELRLQLVQLSTGVSQMFSHLGCQRDGGAGAANESDGIDMAPPGTASSVPRTAGSQGQSGTSGADGGDTRREVDAAASVNSSTILTYIGIIEQRTTEIVQQYTRLLQGAPNDTFTFTNPFGPPHPHDAAFNASVKMSSVPRPTLEEAKQDLQSTLHEGEAVRPLSRFELTARVMNSMQFDDTLSLPKI